MLRTFQMPLVHKTSCMQRIKKILMWEVLPAIALNFLLAGGDFYLLLIIGQKVSPDLDPNCLTLIVFRNIFFKVDF